MVVRRDEELGTTLVSADIEIGAVEIKDGTTDTRATVGGSGLGVYLASTTPPATAASATAVPGVFVVMAGETSGSAIPLQLDTSRNLMVAMQAASGTALGDVDITSGCVGVTQHAQYYPTVWSYSGSLGDTDTISGSLACGGYAKLCGMVWSSCTAETASGLQVLFSVDAGANWDHTAASDGMTASTAAACCVDIVGTAVKVELTQGAASGDIVRAEFWLRPV